MTRTRSAGRGTASRSWGHALEAAYRRAQEAEARDDLDAAGAALRDMLELDPADRAGAALRLAALGLAESPHTAAPAYVALLFDQNADMFDHMLVEQLGYHTPMELRVVLDELGAGPFRRLLDLGCGTGLLGESLRDRVEHATGVDLSEKMIEIADEKDVYDALFVGDAVGYLDQADETWDLIAATDVLPYLGDVRPLLAAASARCVTGGLLALSTEEAPREAFNGRPFIVGRKRRYAHEPEALKGELAAVGFETLRFDDRVIRWDEGEPVPGRLLVARRLG